MAEITDFFGKASIDTNYAQATTVKTARTPGETVLAAFDLSKFAPDTPVFFVTYQKEVNPTTNEVTIVNQTSWKALVNPGINTLTNLELAPGYTDVGNDVGDYVECIPTSYWGNSLVNGLSVSLNPDGTLKSPVGIGKVPEDGVLDVDGDIYSNGEKVLTSLNVTNSYAFANSKSITTSFATVYTATSFCFVNVYLDYTSAGKFTVVRAGGIEKYLSPQYGRCNVGVFLNVGQTIEIKADTAYTVGWMRIDVQSF